MPKVSVIIPVYNTEKYVSDCLDSLLNQSFKDWEAICIDDGSTDNSLKILKKYAKKDKRIKILSQKNQGVVVARNNAIKHASAELIYPLDSDDIIAEETLEKSYNALLSNKGDIITCKVMQFGTRQGELKLPKPNKYNMVKDNCLVNAALFRKSDFIKCGGYSKDYSIALEDYELWVNMLFAQHKRIYRIPEILFYYRIKNKKESRNFQNRARHNFLVKQLQIRYPQMKKYIYINKISNIFLKILRFFFRIQDNKIKIFKIPVCSINFFKTKKLYYFNYRANFGDLLNINIFKSFFNLDVIKKDVSQSEIVAIGSVLGPFFSDSKIGFIKKISILLKRPILVWGTCFIEKENCSLYPKRRFYIKAIRGYLTLQRLKKEKFAKISKNLAIGDPGLLASMLIDHKNIKKKYDLGIIPHYVDQRNQLLKKIKVKNSIILDITEKPEILLPKIASCKSIISSAMHGLIVADSLGIPNMRIILSDKITGGDYKFNDYYSVFGIKKHNFINLKYQFFNDSDLKKMRKNYNISQQQIQKIQHKLINTFPYK